MSNLFVVTCFVTSAFVGLSLLCFFGKDFLWRLDLASRKAAGFPEERLKRGPDFDMTYNLIGIASLSFAIFLSYLCFWGDHCR